ncbi:hypothetical protein J5Y04_18910 [Kitasatospora sp. RG8]|uniref:hypothetical protein n=1 Tax=Kitasatospora sp. RG8 TaxID=2820815 RepID=UPI001ADFC768|nr:hypothetical protein [Kitasatospora sp. RG8]MBP0451600.1 hypothetical protein [Kitasatospora sp. RG8]
MSFQGLVIIVGTILIGIRLVAWAVLRDGADRKSRYRGGDGGDTGGSGGDYDGGHSGCGGGCGGGS